MSDEVNIYEFQDIRVPPDIYHDYSDTLLASHTPLIIDNGSPKNLNILLICDYQISVLTLK